MMDQFLALSIDLTGFTRFALQSTGMSDEYLNAAVRVLGKHIVDELLTKYTSAITSQQPRREQLRRQILGDERLGPIARNIIKMWYSGIWEPLPNLWVERYGPIQENSGFMVSGNAYREGLLWLALGANPPGAKAHGYDSWSKPPQFWEPPALTLEEESNLGPEHSP
jgi:hypothetical protein